MKFNQWTLGLAAVGVISLGSAVRAEEAASQVLTAVSGTTLSGYVNTSAVWKFGTGNANLPGRTFDGPIKQDHFNLDAIKLTLQKPLDEAEWAAGYKVDFLYGPDAAVFSASGLGVNLGAHGTIQNAYVNLRAPVGNGLDIKVGAFDTIIGYEVFDAGSNPNYSRSFGYMLEPVQHAGVLASYRVSDILSASAGVANSAVGLVNGRAESVKTYLASVTLTAPEALGPLAGSTLYAGIIDGTGSATALIDSTWLYTGATLKTPWEQLSLGVAFDYVFNKTGTITAVNNNTGNWGYAVAGYASYQLSEKLKLNNRVDYTTGSDGVHYDAGVLGTSDKQNEIFAYTATVEYALWENVLTRAEFRWDHSLGGDKPFGGSATADGDKNALSVAANLIYKF